MGRELPVGDAVITNVGKREGERVKAGGVGTREPETGEEVGETVPGEWVVDGVLPVGERVKDRDGDDVRQHV